MKSIGARLTVYYALAATATAACLFIAGYHLLESRLIRGLDQLNDAEFEQLRVRMGPDYAKLTPAVIGQRIRETAEAGSAIFYINVDEPHSGMIFYSNNLHHQSIPDVKGKHIYNTNMPGIGELRTGEYVMRPFDVTIATPMAQVRDSMQSYYKVCAGLLAAMLLASITIGRALSRMILRPLNFIRETAGRIGSDNLSERIPVPAHKDELTDLARFLNEMFDRLERSFTQIKRFAADASHELKTPLSLIRLHGEKLLEDDTLTAAQLEAIAEQLDEVARLNQIIDEMLFLARAEAQALHLTLKSDDPQTMLMGFEQDAQALAEHHGMTCSMTATGSGIVAFEERWLRQVWLNLLTNALNFTPRGGRIGMTSDFDEGAWRIVFTDEGPGLPEDQLARIFDRFIQFSSSERAVKGSGLGLTIARSIVTLHGGQISATNRTDRSGLQVTVRLPVIR